MTNKFKEAFIDLKDYLIEQIKMDTHIYNMLYLENDPKSNEQCHSWRHARDELRTILDYIVRLEIKYKLDKEDLVEEIKGETK